MTAEGSGVSLDDMIGDEDLKWFRGAGERHLAAARSLRAAFEPGELVVFAPSLLRLEIVNVAGRRWRWSENALVELAAALDELELEVRETELGRVAQWTAHGLTAYDAAYVALADQRRSGSSPTRTESSVVPQVATALADVTDSGG